VEPESNYPVVCLPAQEGVVEFRANKAKVRAQVVNGLNPACRFTNPSWQPAMPCCQLGNCNFDARGAL